jgi:hypothetical protein
MVIDEHKPERTLPHPLHNTVWRRAGEDPPLTPRAGDAAANAPL